VIGRSVHYLYDLLLNTTHDYLKLLICQINECILAHISAYNNNTYMFISIRYQIRLDGQSSVTYSALELIDCN
jgi:hypothetical protein